MTNAKANVMTIVDAMADRRLFASFFRDPTSWAAWRAFLKALFGLAMLPQERALYELHTGRTDVVLKPHKEAWIIVGRRGGKSFIASLIAVYLATFRDYRKYLAPGERGVVMLIAQDRKQARVLFRYVSALLPTTRPSHAEKHGIVLPADDPFWNTWYPPNGFNCYCTVQSVSESLLKRRGWSVGAPGFQFPDPDPGFAVNAGRTEQV